MFRGGRTAEDGADARAHRDVEKRAECAAGDCAASILLGYADVHVSDAVATLKPVEPNVPRHVAIWCLNGREEAILGEAR